MKNPLQALKHNCFLLIALLTLNMWGGHMTEAQNSNEYGQAYVAYDLYGNGYTASQLKIPTLTGGSTPPPGMQPNSETCVAGMFTLYFQDVIEATGCGFDEYALYPGSTVSLGSQRQAVVCQVFEDLSELINEVPGVNVNVELRGSKGCLSGFPLLGSAYGVGTSTYTVGLWSFRWNYSRGSLESNQRGTNIERFSELY